MVNPEEVISYEEFRGLVNKVKGSRHHKIKNSYGVYDGYKFYRKTKPKESKYILTESQYFSIIRKVNKLLADLLSKVMMLRYHVDWEN